MISISRGARSEYSRTVIGVVAAAGHSFVAFRQPVYEGVSPSTVSATIRLHEPDGVQALISRYYVMNHDVPHGCDFLLYPGHM